MFAYLSRTGNFASALRATSHAIPSPSAPIIGPVALERAVRDVDLDNYAFARNNVYKKYDSLQAPGSGSGTTTQVRHAHTDIKSPNFDNYRRDSTKDVSGKSSRESVDSRRLFTYGILAAGASIPVVTGAKGAVHMLINTLSPSAGVTAVGKVEIKLDPIPEGKCLTMKWRGKPLFVFHRSPSDIERARKVNVSELRDPQTDESRAQNPEWLIVIGVCTHLGCVPIANSGDFGGFFCPCHGSHYDGSGRIRKGPAPLNLEVPPYEFTGDGIVTVG